jgi:ribose transport system ATP-binding protein
MARADADASARRPLYPVDGMTDALLHAERISKAFVGIPVLRDVGLDLHRGEILALVGANGAGKSTLIKIICGALHADAGTIAIDGARASYRNVREAVAAGVSVAHQHNMTITRLTGAQNIELGREPTRFGLIDRKELRRRAEALWREFDVGIDIDAECGDLGAGEQKILDILKALAVNPKILILDEPTATLTLGESKRLFAFLDRLRQRDIGIIFISHHLQEVFDHCDRVVVLKDGKVVFQGTVAETTREELVQLMIGRTIDALPDREAPGPQEEMVGIRGMVVGRLNVEEFNVGRGEIVGVAGLIGSGQTEMLQCIAGARRPDRAGTISILGAGLPGSVAEGIGRGIRYIPDDRTRNAIFAPLSVEENLSAGSLGRLSARGFFTRRRAATRADALIGSLSIKCRNQRQVVNELSGGNQQKVSFGRWLSPQEEDAGGGGDRLFLLDNPTEGVDVGAKAEFYRLIRRLAEDGATIVVASVEFAELIAICDRIYCISHGVMREHFAAAGTTEEELLLKAN